MLRCRACLEWNEEKMIPFDEKTVLSYNLLTNLGVKLFDDMPQQLCENCFKALDICIQFRLQCIESNSYLCQQSKKLLPFHVKEEKYDVDIDFYKEEEVEEPELNSEELVNDNLDIVSYDEGPYEEEKKFAEKEIKSKKLRSSKIKKKLPASTPSSSELILDCGLCKETFNSIDILSKHIETHKNCSLCGMQISAGPALSIHRLEHLSKTSYNHCHICSIKYKNIGTLRSHYLKTHYYNENITFKCSECDRAFKDTRSLRKHKWATHSTRKYICDYCKKIFNRKPALQSHILLNHLKMKTYSCDQCDYSSYFNSNLREHCTRRHNPDRVYCPYCGRVFINNNKLLDHSYKCNSLKSPNMCPICGKIFEKASHMNRHVRMHDDSVRFKCDRCPASYKNKTALTEHQNKHDGIRTRHCEYCGASFYTLPVLIKHRRIHTGEKPYVCKVCHKGFTGNNNLKVHMKVHGEYLVVKRVNPKDLSPQEPTINDGSGQVAPPDRKKLQTVTHIR